MTNLFNIKNKIMLWLGGAIAIMLAIFHIRKGGADAQKQKYTEAMLEAANETIRQDAIVRDGSADIKRMSTRLSEAMQRKRNP